MRTVKFKSEKAKWIKTRAFRDRIIVYAAGALVFVVSSVFNLFERFTEWAGQYEIWHLGELIITAAIMVVALEFVAMRGWRELLVETTHRKRAEQELQYKEEYFRALIDRSSDAICVLNGDGTLRYAGPSIQSLLGYKPEEHIGDNLLEYLHPDDAPGVIEAFAQLLENPGSTMTIEVRIRHEDGSWRTMEAITNNLVNDPIVAGIVVNSRDITERKQAEEQKRRMEQQVHHAGRLAAIGELAAGVAHELNNPLSAVQGFAQLLASRKDLDESIKEDLQKLFSEIQRATKITSNLLSFSRRQKPEKSLICINDVIQKSVELHAYRMRLSNIELLLELAPDLPMTMADFHQMQQVFVNLITNAEQAMTEVHGRGKLCVKTYKEGDIIRITFTDDGPGIPEENLSRIFESFFTTKEAGKGTGLGLGICRGIAQNHGGCLYVRSKLGEGTTFIVEIPILTEEQPIAEETETVEATESQVVGDS